MTTFGGGHSARREGSYAYKIKICTDVEKNPSSVPEPFKELVHTIPYITAKSAEV